MSRRHAAPNQALPIGDLSQFQDWLYEQGYAFPKKAPNPYEVLRAQRHDPAGTPPLLLVYRNDRNPGVLRVVDDDTNALSRFRKFQS